MRSSFKPGQKANRYRISGRTDTGEPIFGEPVECRFSPIKLNMSIAQTSIRTDKSGSQSRAEEESFDGTILVLPDEDLQFNDILEIFEKQFRVVSIYPRHGMDNRVHHKQVDLMTWDSKLQD